MSVIMFERQCFRWSLLEQENQQQYELLTAIRDEIDPALAFDDLPAAVREMAAANRSMTRTILDRSAPVYRWPVIGC